MTYCNIKLLWEHYCNELGHWKNESLGYSRLGPVQCWCVQDHSHLHHSEAMLTKCCTLAGSWSQHLFLSFSSLYISLSWGADYTARHTVWTASTEPAGKNSFCTLLRSTAWMDPSDRRITFKCHPSGIKVCIQIFYLLSCCYSKSRFSELLRVCSPRALLGWCLQLQIQEAPDKWPEQSSWSFPSNPDHAMV